MLYVYLFIGAGMVPLLNAFFPVLRQSYSWWLVPVIVLGTVLAEILVAFLLFGLMIITAPLQKKEVGGENFFRFLVQCCLPIMVYLAGVRIKNSGLELAPDESENCLFVCNHQHDFDPVMIYLAFPNHRLSFIGKKDILTEMPLAAKIMKRLRCFFIDRENDREAAKTIVSAIKRLKDKQNSVCVFPEGYCSKDGEIHPLRNGSLKIALKTGVPIVVCVLDDTRVLKKNVFRRKSVINFRVVEVIRSEEYEGMNSAKLGERIYEDMKTDLAKIRAHKKDEQAGK